MQIRQVLSQKNDLPILGTASSLSHYFEHFFIVKTLFLCLPIESPKMPSSSPDDKPVDIWMSWKSYPWDLQYIVSFSNLRAFRYHPMSAFFPLWKFALPHSWMKMLVLRSSSIRFSSWFVWCPFVFVKFAPPCLRLCPDQKMSYWSLAVWGLSLFSPFALSFRSIYHVINAIPSTKKIRAMNRRENFF